MSLAPPKTLNRWPGINEIIPKAKPKPDKVRPNNSKRSAVSWYSPNTASSGLAYISISSKLRDNSRHTYTTNNPSNTSIFNCPAPLANINYPAFSWSLFGVYSRYSRLACDPHSTCTAGHWVQGGCNDCLPVIFDRSSTSVHHR